MYAIAEVDPTNMTVRLYGPYETEEAAERARRDRHMDFVLANTWKPPRSIVKELETLP